MEETRPDWNDYFARLAFNVATRSTCPRKQVGAVIVRDRNILSTGYNGSIGGLGHCTEIGCLMKNNHCIRTVHAEANALVQSAKHGISVKGATIFVTASPCWYCFKLIANAGIIKVCYSELYRDERIIEYSEKAGIELVDLTHINESNIS